MKDKVLIEIGAGIITLVLLVLGWSLNKNISSIESSITALNDKVEKIDTRQRETHTLVSRLSGRLSIIEP